jgi:hypothetical protein
VAQESFFAFAQICDVERFHAVVAALGARPDGLANRWLRSRVEFEGAFAGSMELTLPYTLAADLLMAFTGATPGDSAPESHVLDSTGEFANMVCGTWLTRACVRRRFDLRSPVVAPASSPVWRPTDGQEELVLVNDQPVSMKLEFRAS